MTIQGHVTRQGRGTGQECSTLPSRAIRRASLALGMLAFAGAMWAQVAGSISGTVEDPAGKGVNGASVTVTNQETGAARMVTTGESGNYQVLSLPVGPYQVRAEKSGFKTEVRDGVNLVVAQQAAVNLQLSVGEVSEQVTVNEQVPLINTTTSSVSGLVGEREVKELPLNGRSFDSLVTLNPSSINYGLKSANTSTSFGNTFSVAGRRPMDNVVLLNGVEYGGSSQLAVTPGGVSGDLLGIDAVREFNVLTDTYGAEYGKRDGGQISVVTQSGTNTLHGSLYEFLRNGDVDARSIFTQTSSTPPFHQNQFGASLGGPLIKDKLFLFGNYEGFRLAENVPSESVVPDGQARLGFLPNSAGVETAVPKQNAQMSNYFSFWPSPNGGELLSNGLPSGDALSFNSPAQSVHENFGTLRSDYSIRANDSLSAAYTIDDGNSLIPVADPLFGSISTLRMQVASLQETHVFSPSMLNTVHAGFSRAGFALDSSPFQQFPAALDFVSGLGPGGITVNGGVTTSGLTGITAAGPNNAAGVWNRRNLFTYSDDFQEVRGRHQISAGIWFQRVQDNDDTASRQTGVATFASLTTFLQGTTSNFQVVPNANELGWRSLFGAWYVQDVIKVTPRLSVRIGLRHEFTTGWNEESGRAANYVPDANGVLQTNPIVGGSAFTRNNATKLFSPRVGLAWDPFGKGKTAFRAGGGMYYSLIDDLSFLLNSLPPANGSIVSSGNLFNLIPVVPNSPIAPSCSATVTTGCAIYAPQGVQSDAKTPAVVEWNASVEQQISSTTALRVAYIGSHGYHGLISIDPNSIAPQICAAATCQAGGVITTGAGAGNPVPVSSQSTVVQGQQYIPVSTRPNPFLGAGFFWYTEGNTSYNALQVEVTHRFSSGLQFRGSYTYSKSLDMNSALTIAQGSNQPQMVLNRFDVRRDWGPSALNPAQQVSISGRYELPFGHGKPWLNDPGVAQHIFGGWQLNEITTLLSGFPFTPLVGADRSGDGDTRNPDRPNLNTSFTGPVILGHQQQWFNPAAFSPPAFGTYGNLGRGVYTGPGFADVDVSLFKDIPLHERANLQFRAEFFNALNHTNLGNPNATVFSGTNVNPSAGLITTLASNPRQIQFALKLTF